MRIDVSEQRIECFCSIPGWRGEQSVIALIKNGSGGKWHCGSSMCLPSDIESAKVVNECVAAAFLKLEQLTSPHN